MLSLKGELKVVQAHLSKEKKNTLSTLEWRLAWPSGRALYLESGGPGFKSSSLPLDGFVFGGPEFNSSTLCI